MTTVLSPPDTSSKVSAPNPPAVTCPPPAPERLPSAAILIPEFFNPALAFATFKVGVPERSSKPDLIFIASAAVNVVLPDLIPAVKLPLTSSPELARLAPLFVVPVSVILAMSGVAAAVPS